MRRTFFKGYTRTERSKTNHNRIVTKARTCDLCLRGKERTREPGKEMVGGHHSKHRGLCFPTLIRQGAMGGLNGQQGLCLHTHNNRFDFFRGGIFFLSGRREWIGGAVDVGYGGKDILVSWKGNVLSTSGEFRKRGTH